MTPVRAFQNTALSTPHPHRLPSKVAREDEPLLVKAAKSGDAAAFEELVNRYETKIFRLTQNITQNPSDADNVVQNSSRLVKTPCRNGSKQSCCATEFCRELSVRTSTDRRLKVS